MQAEVDKLAVQFKEHVLNQRDVDDDHMQGQIFTGAEAEQCNLTDGAPHTLEEVLALF